MENKPCFASLSPPLSSAFLPLSPRGPWRLRVHGSKPARDAVVIDCATQHKGELVTKGKLDKTWQSVKVDKAELFDGKKGKECARVMLKDVASKDKAKETLYMFFTAPGNFIAANFTGQ